MSCPPTRSTRPSSLQRLMHPSNHEARLSQLQVSGPGSLQLEFKYYDNTLPTLRQARTFKRPLACFTKGLCGCTRKDLLYREITSCDLSWFSSKKRFRIRVLATLHDSWCETRVVRAPLSYNAYIRGICSDSIRATCKIWNALIAHLDNFDVQ